MVLVVLVGVGQVLRMQQPQQEQLILVPVVVHRV
jgi:hypothetical protein|tara:strand:- start:167 stop:268 length:102 start_codon:yes stop_codon:yes gene_type:complete